MRKELAQLEGLRQTFTGTFVKTGIKHSFGHPKQTLLFQDVKDPSGKIVTDHLWFNLTKGFAKLNLVEKDEVEFDARVKQYEKGYKGFREDVYCPIRNDYKLSHPTNAKKI